MKFKASEHKAMIEAIREAGLRDDQVLFVKRRGRLRVNIDGRKEEFVLFRKKDTTLVDGRWVETTNYFLGEKNDHAVNWEDVLITFGRWLMKVNS